jgi:prevent-host-death family protein
VTIVNLRQAKMHLSKLLKGVSEGEEVIISRGSEPVARLVAIRVVNEKRRAGALKGQLRVGPEFFEPLPTDELIREE